VNNKEKDDQEKDVIKFCHWTVASFKSRWTQKNPTCMPEVWWYMCNDPPPDTHTHTYGELGDDEISDRYYERMQNIYEERARDKTWKDWKRPKKFNKFMMSYLYLCQEMIKFGPIFKENVSVVEGKQDGT
jgi:hypothetical protein